MKRVKPSGPPSPEPFYAASPHKSGVYFFATMDQANTWVNENDGFRLAPEQVDPAIRYEGRCTLYGEMRDLGMVS